MTTSTTRFLRPYLPSPAWSATLMILFMILPCANAQQQLQAETIDISPETPNTTWQPTRELYPDESVQLTVTIASTGTGTDGKTYQYDDDSSTVTINSPQSLWTTTQGSPGDTSFTFELVNMAETAAHHTVTVAATWSTEAVTGGGKGASNNNVLPGTATGEADTEIPVFLWYYPEGRLEFADGQTEIDFNVSPSYNGATIPLDNYTIHGLSEWNITTPPPQGGTITGTVTSDTPGKGKLKVTFNGNDVDESDDEIAFAKCDLAIASVGTQPNLAEDRQPGGGNAPTLHEMDPGGIVIAPSQGATNSGVRTKLTITGNGAQFTDGNYKLTVDSALSKVKIYTAAEGGSVISLPKTYSGTELANPVTLYVGSDAFTSSDTAQDGNLILTYDLTLADDSAKPKLEDRIRVRPVLMEVVELSPQTRDEEGNEIAGSERPNSGLPLTPFVEVNPHTNKIAHREMKVLIGSALKDKKVTWTLDVLPGATPASIRGNWAKSPNHQDRFEASTAYGANGFRKLSQTSGETTVGTDGYTAIRVNVPPVGFNQVRIKIQIESISTSIGLIDMEVPGVVVIDPGHGGTSNEPGSTWNNATSTSGVLEKAMARDYGLALRDSLRAIRKTDRLNLRIFMTRETDINRSAAFRAAKARDNGADIFHVIHFNAFTDTDGKPPDRSHTARGTLEVYRTDNNVFPEQDRVVSADIITRIVAAMIPFDAGANHKARVGYSGSPAVASDLYNGNTAAYCPVRTAYIEVEFIDFGAHTPTPDDDLVDILLNTGPNGAAVKTAIADAMRDGILHDLRHHQPQP